MLCTSKQSMWSSDIAWTPHRLENKRRNLLGLSDRYRQSILHYSMGIHKQSETPSYMRESLLSSSPTLPSIPSVCSNFTHSTPGNYLWHGSRRYSAQRRLSRQSNAPWRVSLSPAMRRKTHLGHPHQRRTYIMTAPVPSWCPGRFAEQTRTVSACAMP